MTHDKFRSYEEFEVRNLWKKNKNVSLVGMLEEYKKASSETMKTLVYHTTSMSLHPPISDSMPCIFLCKYFLICNINQSSVNVHQSSCGIAVVSNKLLK